MKGYLITFIGFLFIACPFTIIIGIYLIDKGLNEIEKEIKKMNREEMIEEIYKMNLYMMEQYYNENIYDDKDIETEYKRIKKAYEIIKSLMELRDKINKIGEE